MRVLQCVVIAALTMAAPSALACQFANPPPALPRIFWESTAQAAAREPGTIVVEVAFIRDARMVGRTGSDIVIVGCGPTHRVYRVMRVIAGGIEAQQEILVPTGYDFASQSKVLVGRLITQEQLGWAAHIGLDTDPSLLVIQPELPPQ